MNENDKTISYKNYSASIDHALIDIELGTTVSGTTNVPTEFYKRPKEERDKNASQLIIERHEPIKHTGVDLTGAVHRLLETPDSSEQLKAGNFVIVMHSNFYGSAVGGDVHQPNIAYIQEWNQVKNGIDIDVLKTEIEKAIGIMQKSAAEGGHYEDIANLRFASDELKKADGLAMLKHLKKVGAFGLDIIKGTGSSILVALLLGG